MNLKDFNRSSSDGNQVDIVQFRSENILKKYGWTRGKGLGKDEQGRLDSIKTKKKTDLLGCGPTSNYEFKGIDWWSDLYAKASEKITIQSQLPYDDHSDDQDENSNDQVKLVVHEKDIKSSTNEKNIIYNGLFVRGEFVNNEEESKILAEGKKYIHHIERSKPRCSTNKKSYLDFGHDLGLNKQDGKQARLLAQELAVDRKLKEANHLLNANHPELHTNQLDTTISNILDQQESMADRKARKRHHKELKKNSKKDFSSQLSTEKRRKKKHRLKKIKMAERERLGGE